MEPEDLKRLLGHIGRGRRDFLKHIIAGAAFAPPLIASFSLDGPSIAPAEAQLSNQCVANQTPTVEFFNFAGTEYQDNFRGILRPTDIVPGTDLAGGGHPALNFRGTAGAGGSTWLTVLDANTPIPGDQCQLTLSVDVLFHTYNNSKGAGLLALFNEGAGQKGLALFVFNAGNTDNLQIVTVDQAGRLTVLQTISLRGAILENVWYRLSMELPDTGAPSVTVTGTVSRHVVPTNPNSPLVTPPIGTAQFVGALPAGVEPQGEVGLVARATAAVVDLSMTNFTITESA